MDKYRDRSDAGKTLALLLERYKNNPDVLVLALPRGGVPVAFEIARHLHLPLDVFIVRKLGVPGHPELAMGAIAMGNTSVFNQDVIRDLHIPNSALEVVKLEESKELLRREKAYRGEQPFPHLEKKIVILVDDGVATGATVRAAIHALKSLQAQKIILAIPVADQGVCEQLAHLVDELVCPLRPSYFYAVGAWYEYFNQTGDEEVFALLEAARKNSVDI